MEPDQSTLQVAYSVSIVTSIVVCGILWRHRNKAGVIPLYGYILSGLFWGGNQLANVTVTDPAISEALLRSLYIGISIGAASLFVFALEYTGRERYLGLKTYLVLAIHPLVVTVFALTDPGGLFFGTVESGVTSTGVAPEYGIALVGHLLYTYLLSVATFLLFVDMLYRTHSLYRIQSTALVCGAILPSLPPLLLVFGIIQFDATPLAIPVASALFTVAIVRYRLIDLVPIARDRVVDSVNDGVFVVDGEDRLIDVNPEGRRILSTIGVDDDTLVGQDFPSLLPNTELQAKYETVTAQDAETTFEVSMGPTHFQVTATPIDDGRGRQVGWLAIAHDVTERKRREERLERQNERLEQFASLVSHDLRNPLTVANGYLELARDSEDNDEYLEKVARAHDRMETIIEDVLTLAREGETVTDPEPVALDEVVEQAWTGVATGDATLTVETSTTIRADPERLRRLLENLFRNSVEHSSTNPDSQARRDSVEHGSPTSRPTAGEAIEQPPDEPGLVVTVGSSHSRSKPALLIYVEDNGPGIPEAEREKVFDAGYSTGEEGTGFGLSIVQQIAEAHGWTVTAAESTSGGARFEFSSVESADREPTDELESTASPSKPASSLPSKSS